MYAPRKWFDMHPRQFVELPPRMERDQDDLPAYVKQRAEKSLAPPHAWMVKSGEWQHAVQAYLASTSLVDGCVGALLDALDESPHADNTIVVLFSDNGWHLGEKGRWAKGSLWERSTRVPLIVTLPKSWAKEVAVGSTRTGNAFVVPASAGAGGELAASGRLMIPPEGGTGNNLSPGDAPVHEPRAPGQHAWARNAVCNRPVGLIDVYPTLIELCRLPSKGGLEGHSLRVLLKTPDGKWPHTTVTTFGQHNHAVRSEQWRYIRYADGSEELYDLRSDPHEWYNLAGHREYADVVATHRRGLPAVNVADFRKSRQRKRVARRPASPAKR
jgi:arylsulfatase A-like enzyme